MNIRVSLASSLIVFASLAVLLAPGAVAGTPIVPTPGFAVANLPADWSALTKGILAAPPIANGNAVPVGYEISAQIAPIDYTTTSGPSTYQFTWLACPSRGVPDNSCIVRTSGPKERGNPSNGNSTITASPDDAMRYMRFQLTITPSGTWDGTKTVTTDPAKDILVISKAAQTSQPDVPKNQAPGTTGSARLAKWEIPTDSDFRTREVSAWTCSSATAGQVRDASFDAATAGCTQARVLTSVAENSDQKDLQIQIPADAKGQYLLVQDTLTIATGASSTLSSWVVRSSATPLQGSQPIVAQTPPTTLSVIAKKRASRGKPFLVALSVSPAQVTGTASIRLVPVKGSGVPTSLGRVAVTTGTGLLERRIPASLSTGSYKVVVDFVPASAGDSVTATSDVRVK